MYVAPGEKLENICGFCAFFAYLCSTNENIMQKNITPNTNYRLELHDRILRTSMEEFMRKGIKAVRMDDIANLLSISKRTLYEIYSNKEELLLEGVKMYEEEYEAYMSKFAANHEHDVMDIIIEYYNHQIEFFSDINSKYLEELHRYSHVVEYLEKRGKMRRETKRLFFEQGIKEGFFRSDLDYEILSGIINCSMDYIFEGQLYKKYGMTVLLHNVVLLFIRGVCTMKGIAKLDAFFEK